MIYLKICQSFSRKGDGDHIIGRKQVVKPKINQRLDQNSAVIDRETFLYSSKFNHHIATALLGRTTMEMNIDPLVLNQMPNSRLLKAGSLEAGAAGSRLETIRKV